MNDNIYTFDVIADDGTTNRTTQTITVTLEDVDVAPVLSLETGSAAVVENNNLSYYITGRDQFDGQALTISLSGEDSSAFVFNEFYSFTGYIEGVLDLVETLDFENPTDADGDNVYIVDVNLSDGVNTTTSTLTLTVLDFFESENAPVFTTGETFVVDEGQAAIATVVATDADNETPTYFISGGDDRYSFAIDSTTGELSFTNPPQFNADTTYGDNFYTVEISADDGSSNITTQTVTVEIVNADVAPEFNSLSTSPFVNENSVYSDYFWVRDDYDDQDLTITLSGEDSAAFIFDLSSDYAGYISGRLELLAPLDFENPTDADGDNVYVVDVTVTDGVNTVTETVSLTVEDLFESANAPVFTTADSFIVDEGQATIVTVIATDADGETPTYSIVGGDDRYSFAIDSTTGDLTFSNPPQFNADTTYNDNFYTVEIAADDGSQNITSQLITVEVVDADVAPEISYLDTSPSVNENAGYSNYFAASDNYDGQNLTITLGGEDAAAFTFNLGYGYTGYTYGYLELAAPLDFENPTDADGDNVYVVDVTVTDGVNTVTETVSLTIEDLFESANAPVFTTADSFTVDEGEASIVTVIATDADDETPTYSIVGGDDPYSFAIDSTTGDLTFSYPPQFDADMTYGDNFYTVEIAADDGTNNITTQVITVEVVDANVVPVLSSVSTTQVISENTSLSDSISGWDNYDNEDLTITLGGEDASVFIFSESYSYIGGIVGYLGLATSLDFENPTDADGDNIYVVDVNLSDGTHIVTETVTLTVEDVYEVGAQPIFTSPTTFEVDEAQTFIALLEASDADGDELTYTITDGNSAEFSLGGVDGNELSFVSRPNVPDNESFFVSQVEVTVSDGNGNSSIQTISVTVNDVNLPPVLFVESGTIQENQRDTGIEIQGAEELDDFIDYFDQDGNLTIELSGADADLFELQVFGEGHVTFIRSDIFFVQAPDFETPLDADGDNVYEVTVELSDGKDTVTEDITITIEDVNENVAPVFLSPSTLLIDEGQTFVTTLLATDDDGDNVTYSVTGGVDQGAFMIGGVNGDELSLFTPAPEFAFAFDSNSDNIFEVEISAFDGVDYTVQNLIIAVNEIAHVPILTVDSVTIVENSEDSFATIMGTDNDFGDTLTLTLSGDDAALFMFTAPTSDTGFVFNQLDFIIVPDFETPLDADGDNVYEVTVELTDGVNTVTEDITITVTDVFEASANAPIFTTANTFTIVEMETFVANVAATDADGETPTYSIIGGVNQFDLVVDSLTGDLSFAYTPTFVPNSTFFDNLYTVEIAADDGTGNITPQTITVEVTQFDAVPEFSSVPASTTIVENDPFYTSLIMGIDYVGSQDLTISLTGDDAEAFLFIEFARAPASIAGDLQLAAPLDFDNPTDANGDNIYEFTIELTDGVHTVTEDITITVVDDPNETGSTKIETEETSLELIQNFDIDEIEDAVFVTEADDALASFNVEDDSAIDLAVNAVFDLPEEAFTSFDVVGDLPDEMVADTAVQAVFEEDASAIEMQFAADLLMLQDSAMITDG